MFVFEELVPMSIAMRRAAIPIPNANPLDIGPDRPDPPGKTGAGLPYPGAVSLGGGGVIAFFSVVSGVGVSVRSNCLKSIALIRSVSFLSPAETKGGASGSFLGAFLADGPLGGFSGIAESNFLNISSFKEGFSFFAFASGLVDVVFAGAAFFAFLPLRLF